MSPVFHFSDIRRRVQHHGSRALDRVNALLLSARGPGWDGLGMRPIILRVALLVDFWRVGVVHCGDIYRDGCAGDGTAPEQNPNNGTNGIM